VEPEGLLPCSQEPACPDHLNPVHTFSPYFPVIHSSIILPSTATSSEWSFHFRFSDRNFVCISQFIRTTCSSHFILRNLITIIKFREAYKLCSLLNPPATSFVFGPDIPPQHPQYVLFPQCERPGCTPIQNNRSNYSFILIFKFLERRRSY